MTRNPLARSYASTTSPHNKGQPYIDGGRMSTHAHGCYRDQSGRMCNGPNQGPAPIVEMAIQATVLAWTWPFVLMGAVGGKR